MERVFSKVGSYWAAHVFRWFLTSLAYGYMKRNSKHTRWGAVLKWPQGPSQDPSPCAFTRGWGLGWTDTGVLKSILLFAQSWHDIVLINGALGYQKDFVLAMSQPPPPWNYMEMFNCCSDYISAGIQHCYLQCTQAVEAWSIRLPTNAFNRDWRYINLNFWLFTLFSQAQVNKKLERAKVI